MWCEERTDKDGKTVLSVHREVQRPSYRQMEAYKRSNE